jgi:hypothetical protein
MASVSAVGEAVGIGREPVRFGILYVSLDNADKVIEGGPPFRVLCEGWGCSLIAEKWTGVNRNRFMPDEITVSAPDERVDLEALKRPRLGGKEPSDDDYRM